MKRNFFIIPLVLISAAFMWSCQGQVSAPLTGPERPRFATKPVKATFDVTVTIEGNEIGGAPINSKITNGSKNIGGFFDMPLDLSFFTGMDDPKTPQIDGEICFRDPITGSSIFIGAMIISQPQKKAPEQGHVQFFFTAFGNDGTPDIKYQLEMFGTFDNPANWLPDPGTSTTLNVTDWKMGTEGKGQNRKISCTGDGGFGPGTSLKVDRTK